MLTVTVLWQVTVAPAAVVPVPMYVVVTVGDTERVPAATGVTDPIPLSMLKEMIPPTVVHESVDEPPDVIESGDASSVHAGVGGVAVTVIVLVQVRV